MLRITKAGFSMIYVFYLRSKSMKNYRHQSNVIYLLTLYNLSEKVPVDVFVQNFCF